MGSRLKGRRRLTWLLHSQIPVTVLGNRSAHYIHAFNMRWAFFLSFLTGSGIWNLYLLSEKTDRLSYPDIDLVCFVKKMAIAPLNVYNNKRSCSDEDICWRGILESTQTFEVLHFQVLLPTGYGRGEATWSLLNAGPMTIRNRCNPEPKVYHNSWQFILTHLGFTKK